MCMLPWQLGTCNSFVYVFTVHYAVMIKTPERWFVLKTLDKAQAVDWIQALKMALQEMTMPIY